MSTLQQLLKGSKAERHRIARLERKQAILSLQTLKLYYKADMQKCKFISSHSCQSIMGTARKTYNTASQITNQSRQEISREVLSI